MRRASAVIALSVILLAMNGFTAFAQFREDAFQQSYASEDASESPDSTDTMFSLKEFFTGLAHHEDLKIGTLFAGSTVFLGSSQIYHKQYWKLPVVYGGIGAGVCFGMHYNSLYQISKDRVETAMSLEPSLGLEPDLRSRDLRNLCFAAAGLVYWGALMDGVITYKSDDPHRAGKATLFSLLVPGLGQAYNGEYFKVPIYWGCLLGAYHFYDVNVTNYKRFQRIYREANDPNVVEKSKISAETALYYRNVYRRHRDYSVLAIAGFYLLQVIDANVFSYMKEFEVSDDLSLNVSPTVIAPDNQYAFNRNPAMGLSLSFNF